MISHIARIAAALALLSVIVIVASGPAYRLELFDLRTAFTVLKYGAFVVLGTGAVSLIMAVLVRPGTGRAGFASTLVAGLVALAIFGLLAQMGRQGRSVPAIHDITTDVMDPPAFVATLPLRTKALNPAEYGGQEIAAKQVAAYPDLQPRSLALPPAEALTKAEAAAKAIGLQIVAVIPEEGRLEATATSLWFGFVDDVVVRVRPSADGTGSILDVRSKSRVGISDLGANAARIRALLKQFD